MFQCSMGDAVSFVLYGGVLWAYTYRRFRFRALYVMTAVWWDAVSFVQSYRWWGSSNSRSLWITSLTLVLQSQSCTRSVGNLLTILISTPLTTPLTRPTIKCERWKREGVYNMCLFALLIDLQLIAVHILSSTMTNSSNCLFFDQQLCWFLSFTYLIVSIIFLNCFFKERSIIIARS